MSKVQLLIELDEKDYEELNTFYILNLGTEEYRKIIEKHCTDAIRHGKPYNQSVDLDKEIELYKSKVAFYESQNTRGEYDVTARELKFVVETLEKLRSERLQGEGS